MSRKSGQGSTDKLRRRLESLASISKEVLAAPDIEVMLQDIVAEVKKSMDYDFSFCLVKDGECARLYHSLAPKLRRAISKATGLDFTGLEVHYDSEDIYWKSLARGKPLVTRNVLEESDQVAEGDKYLITDVLQFLEGFTPPNYTPRFVRKELRKARFAKVVQEELKIRSAITVPLRTKTGRNVGAFSIATRERAMDREDVEFATLVGDLVGIAIENASLSKMMRVERRAVATFREASQAVASTMEVNELLCLILEHLGRVVAYDTASLMLLSGGTLRTKAAAALGGQAPVVQLSLPLDTFPLSDELTKKKQPIVIADTKEDERWRAVPGNGKVRSWIGVPLLVKGQVIGCLTLNKWEPNYYREEDAQIVMAFANQVAIVIENTRLYETAKSERDRLTAIMSSMEDGVDVVSKDYIVKFQNRLLLERFGDLIGQLCYKGYMGLEEPCEFCPMVKAIETGEPHRVQLVAKDGRDYELISMPLRNPDGSVDAIEIVRDVTERKQAEQALGLQSEIAANMAEGVVLTRSDDGVIVYSNRRFEQMFGYGQGELIGKHVSVLNAPGEQTPEGIAEEIVKCLNENGVWYGEVHNIKKDGTPFWCRASVSTLEHLQHGKVWVSVLEDITERKRAEEALRESEEKFRAIFESTREGVIISGPDGTLLSANPATAAMLGYKSPEELVGMPAIELYADSEQRKALFDELREKGYSEDREITLLKKDGTPIHLLGGATIHRDKEGNILRTEGIFTDITERKRAEEALRESQQLLKRTFSSLRDAIFVIDADTVEIIDCNPAASEIFGYSRDEMLGRTTTFLHVDEAALEEFRRHLYPAIEEKGFLSQCEFKMKRKDGTVFPTEHSVMPLEDEQDKRIGWVSVVRDITQRKRAEETLRIKDSAIASSINAIALADLEGNLTYINPSFLKLWGYDEKEVLGKPATQFWQMEEKASEVVEALSDRGSWIGELVAKRKDGSLFDVQLSASMVTDEAGKPICMMSAFADITERKRAEEDIRRRSEELAALNAVAMAVTSTLDLQEVLHSIQERVMESLGEIYPPLFFLFNEEDQTLKVVPTRMQEQGLRRVEKLMGVNFEEVSLPLPALKPALREALLAGKSCLTDDLSDLSEFGISRKLIKDAQSALEIKSIVSSPLWVKGKLVGTMILFSPKEKIAEEEIELLSAIARQAAIAIQNARLYEEAQARSTYLETMLRINATLRSTLPLNKVLETIVQGTGEALGYVGSLITVPDATGERLVLGAVWGSRFLDAAVRLTGFKVESFGLSLEAEENPIVRTYLTGELQTSSGEPERIVVGLEPPLSPKLALVIERTMEAELAACVPLRVAEKTVGVLTVFSPREQLPDEERAMLLGLADQAGLVIENARLYEERGRKAEELAALYDVSLDVAARLELPSLLKTIVQRAIELLGGHAGGLFLYDHEGQDLELAVHQGLRMDYVGSRLALGQGACGKVAQTGEPLVVTDYSNWEGRSPHFADEPTFNVLAVPIKRGDTLLGALYVDDPDVERRFEEGDVRLGTLFANQAAIAIEKARLFGEVERTRDYLENLIESSPDAIVTTDRQGKINLFSKGAASIFGYKASEVIAQPVSNYYRDSMEVMRIMRRLLREGRLRNHEMEVIDKNGKAIPVILSASLLSDEKGAITGTLGIIKDITARKGLEEELRQYAENLEEMVEERTKALVSLNEQLEKANDLKSEFVSTVSHELRAPLFAIVGMSEMLLDRGVTDRGWTMEYLQIINEQGNRLARLIDDLLDLSRIESGKQVYDWESVQLDEVIKESIQFLKAQAKEKGVAISHRIEKDLPAVEADRDKMRQVVINLISNSLNYSNEGAKVKVFARQLAVRRGPKRGEKIVAVSVTDSGWGIPREDLPYIFEKFYRGNEHQRRTKGSGLGLALVKEIVAAHGGTIEVKSKVGKGSKFTVKLPLAS